MLSYLLCASEAILYTKKKVGHVLRLGTRLGIFLTEMQVPLKLTPLWDSTKVTSMARLTSSSERDLLERSW